MERSRGKPKDKLSFPPLVQKWTVKSQPSWPGAGAALLNTRAPILAPLATVRRLQNTRVGRS